MFPATKPPAPADNLLLGALPAEDRRRLLPHLELVALPVGKVISEPGERVSHVFFPTGGIVSMLALLDDGTSAEIAIVGIEGVVGISSFLGDAQEFGPRYRRAVTMAGHAYQLRVDVLMEEFKRDGELRRQLLRHTQALITQIALTAVCNRLHRLQQQMCRWLLLRLDRLGGSELFATHKQIANQLGVRREGVTEAVSHLEQCVCECYGVIEKEYARLLGVTSIRASLSRTGG